jgi:phage/plasmid-associated DNA primase
LGTYAVSVRAETLAIKNNTDSWTASPDIAKLAGKRLAVASEPQKRMALDVALQKSMTGRDTISARFYINPSFNLHPALN